MSRASGADQSSGRHVLVLGDQLTRLVGPLATAEPESTTVLMIESSELAEELPHHRQKLVLVFAAMRHFADELREDGFTVDYRKARSFEEGIRAHLEAHDGEALELMEPNDWGYEERIREAVRACGASLELAPNRLWLTSPEEFDSWAEGRKTLRLEHFYREQRRARGWLMDGDDPVGGSWNYDKENRDTPPADHRFPAVITFEPDPTTREVMEEVEGAFPHHFGEIEGFAWPVTRSQALEALDDFVQNRLATFGPFEDAIVESEPVLYHSLLSVPLNLGLLHPEEVCLRALDYADDPANDVPLPSIEGFLRQVLGWREFMRHIYRTQMPGLATANELGHVNPLPEAYWGGPTEMRCLESAVRQLERTGHTHHIQRLMILGNLALISRTDPRELNRWFLGCYVDALDWVVTPNVMGMSQFATMGSFTTKPYAASANYVNRMSDHCGRCRYDPKQTTGVDACPLNSLYWDFIDHHADRWAENPRMALMLRNWEKRDPSDRADIVARASDVREGLAAGRI